MSTNFQGIMLIDDSNDDNFFHERELRKTFPHAKLNIFTSAQAALNHIVSAIKEAGELPDAIFLDVNMPIMNGWEFLEEISKLGKSTRDTLILMMCSPIDSNVENTGGKKMDIVSGFIAKPLTKEKITAFLESLSS